MIQKLTKRSLPRFNSKFVCLFVTLQFLNHFFSISETFAPILMKLSLDYFTRIILQFLLKICNNIYLFDFFMLCHLATHFLCSSSILFLVIIIRWTFQSYKVNCKSTVKIKMNTYIRI